MTTCRPRIVSTPHCGGVKRAGQRCSRSESSQLVNRSRVKSRGAQIYGTAGRRQALSANWRQQLHLQPFSSLPRIYAPASSHVHFPPKDLSGKSLFKVHDCIAPRRTAASIAVSAAEVEDARAEGRSVAYQTRLQQKSGVKGYSLFFATGCTLSGTAEKYCWQVGF